jgi:hypothetical protein
MNRSILVRAQCDGDAAVWLATSEDVPGLVVEAETWPAIMEEVRLVLPELLSLAAQHQDGLSITFKAEEHLDLASA